MSTLEEIWTRRFNKLNNQQWNGTPPKSGFNATKPLSALSEYTSDNFADLSISDLRDVLNKLKHGEQSDLLDKNTFTTITSQNFWYSHELVDNTKSKNIRITSSLILDQTQFTIYIPNFGVFSVSWYKDRGSIDSFINTEYGQPINLYELTTILSQLGLEKYTNDDWDSDETFTVKGLKNHDS